MVCFGIFSLDRFWRSELMPQKGMNRILYDPQREASLCNDLLKERKSIDSPRALLILFLVIRRQRPRSVKEKLMLSGFIALFFPVQIYFILL